MKVPETPNNVDLIEILKKPVELKNEGIKASDFMSESESTVNNTTINMNDFDLPPPPPPQPQQQAPSKPRLSESEYEQQAEMTIMVFDGLQSLTLPWLYQRSMFTKEERKKLKELNEKKKKPEVELTEEDLKLEEKYATYKELCDAVPYTEKEVETLKGPLAKVFSKYNVQLGPEALFLSALLYVSIPRYLPLFSKLENLDV